jgi:uncharacterized membrane protein HdeD (DUF308 family)
MNTQGSGLARGLSAILGIFLLILGIFFIYNLFAAAAFLYFLLALALLFGGFVRIVFGLSGDYV